MKITRQHILVGILLVLGGYVVLPYLRPAASSGTPRGVAARAAGDIELPPELNLEARNAGRPAFNPSGGRNLFAYGQPPRPVTAPPPRKATRPPPPRRPVQKVAATPPKIVPPLPPPVTQPARPTPPPVEFNYIGYIGPANARIAVFTVSTEDGREIALAREGEPPQIGGQVDLQDVQLRLDQFLVKRIGYEEVEIGYTNEMFADETKTLFMGGRS